MSEICYTILNNVEVTSIIIIAILVLRLLFRNIPKRIYPLIWGVLGLKLLFPFDIYTSFGFLSSEKTIETASGNAPIIIRTGINAFDSGANNDIDNAAEVSTVTTNSALNIGDMLGVVWIAGVICMLIYLLISYFKMKRKVEQSIQYERGVSVCDEIQSPFLLGIFTPHIYLPSGLEASKREYVLAHERMHIKRKDSLWKMLAYIILSVYWFNPLCWIAYILFCKDIEFACDEGVVKNLEPAWRAEYCQTLLECSNGGRKVVIVPLAFGEVGVKERVKRVLHYKKSKPAVIILAIAVCVVAMLVLGTKHDAKNTKVQDNKSNVTSVDKKEKISENEFYGKVPTIDLSAATGVDGAAIYYADEDTIIFGGYFGLFVYDTNKHQYIQSVDLETIGCSKTQGDEYCEIRVKNDGTEVYLRKMNDKENMLVYHVSDNRFEKKPYILDEKNLYVSKRIDGVDFASYVNETGKTEVYWLVNEWKTLEELGYVCSENEKLVYPLFKENRLQEATYFDAKDINHVVKAEITWEGQHYVCEDKEVLSKIEKGYSKGKKLQGKSACPFYDVMYLTREDGTIGMVIPAMDDCKACIMGDGYYDLDYSLSMSIRKMIKKGLFKKEPGVS